LTQSKVRNLPFEFALEETDHRVDDVRAFFRPLH
jgi:hypothetical protein